MEQFAFLPQLKANSRIAFHTEDARFVSGKEDFYPLRTISASCPQSTMKKLNLLRYTVIIIRSMLKREGLDLRIQKINTRDGSPTFHASRNFLLGNGYNPDCLPWLETGVVKNIVYKVVELNR